MGRDIGTRTARHRAAKNISKGRRLRRALVAVVAAGSLFGATVQPAAAAPDSLGSDFWLGFMQNFNQGGQELRLFITGPTATSGTVDIPGVGFTAPFTVTPGTVTTVAVPSTAEMAGSDVVENKGIHVTAAAEVTVYGLNRVPFTTDAYLGLPVDITGTEYIVLGYMNVNIVNSSEFGIVATADGTVVTITPSDTIGIHPAGVPYNVNMSKGQTYQLQDTNADPADVTGTVIQSNKGISVYGGHRCANIPRGHVACDHIVEQLPATSTWGKSFLSMPLATRMNGDTFRILASQDTTQVKVNGAVVATLNRGQHHEQIIAGPSSITADKPVLVAQYSNSSSYDGVTSDPFEMLVPPFEQFLARYTVTTPASGFSQNFINLVVPNSAVGAVKVDGTAVPAGSYTPIGASGFSGTQVSVALGSHNVDGPLPFGTFVYGFASFDSYGYPGGLSLAPVAQVTSLTIAPKTATNPVGTQHCVTATVKDQNGNPLNGVRVDFEVVGANPQTSFAFTNAAGQAQFCYAGNNAGDDFIKATSGSLTDSASKKWTADQPTTCVVTAVRKGPPAQQDVTVRDLDGVQSITNINVQNGTVAVPPFPPGTTSPIVLTATKQDQTKRTFWEFDVTDSKGNKKHCV